MSPTASTLALLRRRGFLAAIVERRLPHVQRTVDCFGVADVLAVHPRERSVLLVQCTSAAHVSDRVRRLQTRPELPQLLAAGVGVEVWGWALRAGRWRVRIVALRAEDLQAAEVEALPRRRRLGRSRQAELFDVPAVGPKAARPPSGAR